LSQGAGIPQNAILIYYAWAIWLKKKSRRACFMNRKIMLCAVVALTLLFAASAWGGHKTVNFKVRGFDGTCIREEMDLTSALEAIEGVKEVIPDYGDESVDVVFDDEKTSVEDLHKVNTGEKFKLGEAKLI
jgi:copper chaperone CopZ